VPDLVSPIAKANAYTPTLTPYVLDYAAAADAYNELAIPYTLLNISLRKERSSNLKTHICYLAAQPGGPELRQSPALKAPDRGLIMHSQEYPQHDSWVHT
jgi:hypothetical protein